MGRETENQWRRRESSRRAIGELTAFLTDPDRKNRTAARIVDLWDARRARGAEPLFHPTIGGAIRARRPWLTCYCPGCGVVAEIDLRKIDRHPDASIESLIPHLSCQRCSPHPPGLADRARSFSPARRGDGAVLDRPRDRRRAPHLHSGCARSDLRADQGGDRAAVNLGRPLIFLQDRLDHRGPSLLVFCKVDSRAAIACGGAVNKRRLNSGASNRLAAV